MSFSFVTKNISKLLLILVVLSSIFFRFYRLPTNYHFAGDQGRDALVMSAMLRGERLQLLGPTTSVGNYYSGPFYYYFTAPSLWISHFKPIGPAIFHAIIGVITTVCLYVFLKKRANEATALIASGLYGLAPVFVVYNRFAWNPNTIPLFFLLFLWSLSLYVEKKSLNFLSLALLCFSILLQLHLVTLVLVVPLVLALWGVNGSPKKQPRLLVLGAVTLLVMAISVAPLVMGLLKNSHTTGSLLTFSPLQFLNNLYLVVFAVLKALTGKVLFLPLMVGLALFSIGSAVCELRKNSLKKPWLLLIVISLFTSMLAISFLNAKIETHYLLVVLMSLLLISSYGLGEIIRSVRQIWLKVGLILLFCLLLLNSYMPHWQSIFYPTSISASEIEKVTQTIIQSSQNQPFQFAVLSEASSDDPYLYFFQQQNAQIVRGGDVATQLFIVCEDVVVCQPRGNPHWEIAKFEVRFQEKVQHEALPSIGKVALFKFSATE